MKLRTKFLLATLLPVMLVLYGVVGTNQWRWYHEMLDNQLHLIDQQLQTAAARLDAENRDAIMTAQVMALAQSNGLFGHREESLKYARAILDRYPQFIGSYFAYEPEADGQDAAYLAAHPFPNGATDNTGRFLPYWVRLKGQVTLEPVEQMEDPDSLYYRQMKENYLAHGDQYIITEPYLYKDGNYIVEQTSPIVMDGQFKGIAGVDRGLDHIGDILRDLRAGLAPFGDPLATTDFIVLSTRGRVVASTHRAENETQQLRSIPANLIYINPEGRVATHFLAYDHVGKLILKPGAPDPATDTTLDGTYAKLLSDILQQRDEVRHPFVFHDPIRRTDSYMAAAPVPTGGWVLVLTVTRAELLAPVEGRVASALASASAGILVVAGLILWAVNSLGRRIERAVKIAQQVAGGDLTAEVHVDSADEAGQLLQAIGGMIGSLNSLIGQVKRSSIQLISTANEISGTAKIQESTVQDFGASTTQIAAAVKEINATSQELLGTMSGVSDVARDSAALADSGRTQLEAMKAAMQNLAGSTSSISQKLSAITDKAQAITGVVTTITKISDQTNLLSLNAAIEAEKAGEHGLGFGVVAREIRRLADQTAVAVLDIEQMVREMQGAVSAGVMEMDKFSGGVRTRVDEVGGLSRHLESILHTVEALLPRFAQVKEGMTAQSQGARQIDEAMVGLTEGANQTAQSLTEFDRAVRNLHAAVEALRREIARFKVAERPGTGLTRAPFPAPSPKA